MNRMPGLAAALNPKSHNRPRTARNIFLRVRRMRMARQPRIIHPLHRRMFRQPVRERLRILHMPLHAQMQRLNPQQKQKRRKRTHHRRPYPAASASAHE